MIELIRILKIKRLGGFRLYLYFSDGTEGEWDFTHVTAEGGTMGEPLKSQKYFARVFLQLGVLTWPNGFDLDSIALHDEMKSAGALRRTAARTGQDTTLQKLTGGTSPSTAACSVS